MQISVGCNCRCSYCIVPSTRGREVRRPLDELVAEVERLAADGVREVTLLGQNVNSYGRDLRAGAPAVLRRAAARRRRRSTGIDRIRYTSPHPKDMREDVIRAHAELACGLRAHPPAAAVGLVPDPQGDAPHLRPRALPGPRRADPRARARLRASRPTSSSASRARPRRTSRRRSRSARRSATTAPSRSSSRRGAGPRRRRSPRASSRTRSRSSAWSAWSRSSSAAPASARSASSGARSTCSSKARRAPTRRACAAARDTTRP